MTHQQTDRSLVNEVVGLAYKMGYQACRRDQGQDSLCLSEQDKKDLRDRTAVETEIMRRLIVRAERLDALRAEVADLKRERSNAWAELEWHLEQM